MHAITEVMTLLSVAALGIRGIVPKYTLQRATWLGGTAAETTHHRVHQLNDGPPSIKLNDRLLQGKHSFHLVGNFKQAAQHDQFACSFELASVYLLVPGCVCVRVCLCASWLCVLV